MLLSHTLTGNARRQQFSVGERVFIRHVELIESAKVYSILGTEIMAANVAITRSIN